ncbi:MAG: TetR/AcrR family transcriptional regulator [Chloroflexia bacterium]|jgi:AcrR family transcriptional regulator|nr:TetR/AcrR family transcriptional regulator [Chloroflexia bacterium]
MRKPPAIDDSTEEKARRPGRPRSARADHAILQATIELLVEIGYGSMSVEAIAARAQVGKATVYRRWPSKKALVSEALRQLSEDVRIPDTGDTRDDLIALLHDFRRVTSSSFIGPMIGRVISAAIGNPEFMTVYWDNVIFPRRKAVTEILLRGQERGDLRTDLDLELVLDMLPGTMMYRALISRHGLDDVGFINPEELVNTIWAGIASDSARPIRKTPRC